MQRSISLLSPGAGAHHLLYHSSIASLVLLIHQNSYFQLLHSPGFLKPFLCYPFQISLFVSSHVHKWCYQNVVAIGFSSLEAAHFIILLLLGYFFTIFFMYNHKQSSLQAYSDYPSYVSLSPILSIGCKESKVFSSLPPAYQVLFLNRFLRFSHSKNICTAFLNINLSWV